MKFRIMKTDDGKFIAQVQEGFLGFFGYWDDMFRRKGEREGESCVLTYLRFRFDHGWYYNDRYCNTIAQCEDIIKCYKEDKIEEGDGTKKLVKRVK